MTASSVVRRVEQIDINHYCVTRFDVGLKDAEPKTGSSSTIVQVEVNPKYVRNVDFYFKMVYPAVSKVVTLTVAEVS